MGWALRMRWLWLKKTEPDRPWSSFLVQVHSCVSYFFSMAVCTVVGNGSRTLFWMDRWIHGQKIEDLAPQLFALVPKRRANKHIVLEVLTDNTWIGDLQGAFSVGVLAEFLKLWSWLRDTHNKCWTADRLVRHGIQYHCKCFLCDQEEETINHLLVSCVLSRQFWFELLHKFELQILAPQLVEPSFEVWWCRSNEIVADQDRQGLDSLTILGAWSLWNHWNRSLMGLHLLCRAS